MPTENENTIAAIDKKELSAMLSYISPDELREMWVRESSLENISDDALVKAATDVNSALAAQISYWFSVIRKTKIPEHITIQSYALYLIRQYIAVQYDICIFQRRKNNEIEDHSFTYKEYVQEHFPVASSTILGNIFMSCGEFWYIRYNGTCRTVKNYKGMEIIEFLLANPGGELTFQEIYFSTYGDNPEIGFSTSSFGTSEEDPSDESEDDCYSWEDGDEARLAAENSLDINAIAPPSKARGLKLWRINKRLKELQQKTYTANSVEKVTINKMISQLYTEKETLAILSIGEARYKKIKDSLSKNISDVKKYLKGIYPGFYEHLIQTLKQSNHYSPSKDVFWHTKYTAKQFQEVITNGES